MVAHLCLKFVSFLSMVSMEHIAFSYQRVNEGSKSPEWDFSISTMNKFADGNEGKASLPPISCIFNRIYKSA
ncbi:hypothetical protein EUGRSUZ_G00987 [Eucalyptus grandis]|uniref:Uncharacterized protein n=2 Tax=Eucalyptus grandis TaxID=71139 RepID=A0ACC3K2A4_EUCGR|nr:hypothetical protein EUGRSUZ_G00987 [Eucalyptus grandis]